MAKASKKYKTFSERFGDGEFYPDAPKIDFKELLDRTFIMAEAKILKDFSGQFGKHDAALMLLKELDENDIEGQPFTTICSGQVVVERVERALKENALPMICTPIMVKDSYYNLV